MIMDLQVVNGFLPRYGICAYGDVIKLLLPCRAKGRLPLNAKSVIVGVFPYYLGEEAYRGLNVSKYAAVPDYHTVVLERLQKACDALKEKYPQEEFVPFCDNSPVPEVYAAYLAGLGVRGKNGLLITEEYGSYVFIGEIVTTLDIKADNPLGTSCEGCGKCVAKCPGNALKCGFERQSCLSEITQKKSELTKSEKETIELSGCAWGCDVCQDVCPMNVHAGVTSIKEFISGAVPCVSASDSVEGRAYSWRGSEIIKRNLDLLRKE